MGACPECGEGPVVRGICRACHSHIDEEGGAAPAPRRPTKAGVEPEKLEDRRAGWYGAAGMSVPVSRNREELSREAGYDPDEPNIFDDDAVQAAEKKKGSGGKLVLGGLAVVVVAVIAALASAKHLVKALGLAGGPVAIESLGADDGVFRAPELGFTVKVPGDLLAVEPMKLPLEARTLVIVPKGGKGVVVLAADGSFTGLVAGGPDKPGAEPLELLPPGIADGLHPVLSPELIPPSFKQFEAWSFALSSDGDEGTAHLARMPDGRIFVVLGWGPAVMNSRTKGRIAALLQGLAIGDLPAK